MNALLLILSITNAPPALMAESASIDRGELKAGAPLTQSFPFTNRSAHRIAISGVTVSCGCTKYSVDKDSLAPGETATLTVSINTIAQAAGPWSWAASVRYKIDDREESLPLRMTGMLVREVTLTPPGLAFSLAGGSVSQEFTLSDSRAVPLAIKNISSSAAFLNAKLLPGGKPGYARIIVTVAENAPLGEHNEIISIVTSDPVYPEFRVPVKVGKRKPASVQASPETVELNLKNERSLLVQLRRADGKALAIAKCETASSDLKLAWSNGSSLTATLRVTLSGTAIEAGNAAVKVILQDPAGEIITVPVRWTKD